MRSHNKKMTEKRKKLKPLGWKTSLLIFLVTAIILRVTHYEFVPVYKSKTGQPYLIGYLIGYVSTMALIFIVALVVYKLEGNPVCRKNFIARYRLDRLTRIDLLWVLQMILISVVGFGVFSFTQKWLISMTLTAPHAAFPPDFVDPIKNRTPGILLEMPLRGKWWIFGVYFIGWIFNIFGEELWYRGWMLPRQELSFGKYAWLLNGLMFNFQHIHQPWNLLAILPGSLFVAFAVQRQGKTWMSIAWHGLLNFTALIFILQGIVS